MEFYLRAPPPLDPPLTFFVFFSALDTELTNNIFENGHHGVVRVFLEKGNLNVVVASKSVFRLEFNADSQSHLLSLVFGKNQKLALFLDGFCCGQASIPFPVLTKKFILGETQSLRIESFAVVTEEVSAIKQAAVFNNAYPLDIKSVFSTAVISEYLAARRT